jgi:cytochrome c
LENSCSPFNDYDFATRTSGPKFDCGAIVNDSPDNTGLREFPPVQPALLWYAYSASEEFPEPGTGGGGPMSGPVYDYDPDNAYRTKFPEYFDGKWLGYELTRKWFKAFSIQQQGQSFTDHRFPPARQGDLQSINGLFADMSWNQPFDADFGPDGALYVIDFVLGSGTGRGGSSEGSGIYRIDYVADGRLAGRQGVRERGQRAGAAHGGVLQRRIRPARRTAGHLRLGLRRERHHRLHRAGPDPHLPGRGPVQRPAHGDGTA